MSGRMAMGVWDGLGLQQVRAPGIFKDGQTLTGASITLAPNDATKAIRLLRYGIEITAEASKVTSGSDLALAVTDGTGGTVLRRHACYIPVTSVTTNPGVCFSKDVDLAPLGWRLTAGNSLVLGLSFALATGQIRFFAGWVEE